ncbi:UDP-N-acetylmuramoyl-tripeptide--D-alanyl-D-alanine ligase [Clostridia bacterium]|nr:UDP-N-acetylmuramoyl-tripeptide--D-alanyl-D-alanine ligase [Clostridia bacterium]
MKELSICQIAKAVKGRQISGTPNAFVKGVSKDSRQVAPGDMFFPFKGERHDAHAFIPQLIDRGCTSFIISDESAISGLTKEQEGINVILVSDVGDALRDLARYYIRLFDIKKITVTGSNGKTTTKDMIFRITSGSYDTVKTAENMNNEIGLPLSVMKLGEGTEVGIFEMGMYTFGEIDLLADIVRPDVGVITNIGTAHIQNFENRDGIRQAKMEISRYMDEDCSLIINSEGGMLTKENAGGIYDLIRVGTEAFNDFVIANMENRGEDGIAFSLKHRSEEKRFFLPVMGLHNVFNAALSVAAVSRVGIGMEEAAERLREFRLDKLIIKDDIKIIDDTYNASPDSVKAAIDMLEALEGERKIAVLGDMNELGANSAEYHRQVGEYAASRVDVLITAGDKAVDIGRGAEFVKGKAKTYCCADKDGAWGILKEILIPGDVVLVKGSRGMTMETLVKKILE